MTRKCILCDIDGTLANLEHRVHHIAQRPKDWNAFFERMSGDLPNDIVRDAYKLLASKWQGVLVSGRPDQYRAVTEKWLSDWRIPYDGLYMRREGDHRPDDVVKRELLDQLLKDGWEPQLVLDDRDRVVRMWRESGLTCFQVAEGDF